MENKYNIGDQVMIRPDLNGEMPCVNSSGMMDCWAGKIMTIKCLNSISGGYRMEEDDMCWVWTDNMITGFAFDINISTDELMEVLYRDE